MKPLVCLLALLSLSACSSSNSASQQQAQLPAGTEIRVALDQDLDSSKAKDGDSFRAVVSEPVVWEGKTVVPKGAECKGHIAAKQTANNAGSAGALSLVLDNVKANGHSYDVKTGPQDFGATPIEQSASDMAKNSEVAAPVRKELENAVVMRNTILRFLTQEPVNVSVPNQQS